MMDMEHIKTSTVSIFRANLYFHHTYLRCLLTGTTR